MRDDERDLLVLTDEDGKELQLEVLRFFFYNGEEYAMVAEVTEHEHSHEHDGECCDCEDEDGCDCGCEPMEVFFMKVVPVDEENEEYSFVDEALSNELMNVIEAEMAEDEDDEDEDDEAE